MTQIPTTTTASVPNGALKENHLHNSEYMVPANDPKLTSVNGINGRELDNYREQFTLMDLTGNGQITREKLRTVLGVFGLEVSNKYLDDIWRDVDRNKDGVIDFDEFVGLMERSKPWSSSKDGLRDLFNMLDKDREGLVAESDLVPVVAIMGDKYSPDQIRRAIRAVDLDQDGKISFREFESLLK